MIYMHKFAMLVNKLVVVAWAAVLVGLGTAAPAGGSSLVLMDHTQDGRLQDDRLQDDRLQDDRLQDGRLQDGRLQDDRLQDGRLQDDRLQDSRLQDDLKPLSDERSDREQEKKKRAEAKKKKQKQVENKFMQHYLKKRWPGHVIRVMIDKKHPPLKKKMVHEGIAIFNKLTCLRFINSTDPRKYYLRITSRKKGICSSSFGCQKKKRGFQDLNLDRSCFYSISVILHELTHAVGFLHHQCRADRDDYVTVNYTNILNKKQHNFFKDSGNAAFLRTLGLPYQYTSTMHYASDAFSKGSKFGSTVSVKRKFPGKPGIGEGFARIDVASINRYYECWNHYLGDDIPGSVPYADFHAFFMKPKRGHRKSTKALSTWLNSMRKRYSQ
nr:zinc metalloproteinase nas-4-like [Procambarus clarkii]